MAAGPTRNQMNEKRIYLPRTRHSSGSKSVRPRVAQTWGASCQAKSEMMGFELISSLKFVDVIQWVTL